MFWGSGGENQEKKIRRPFSEKKKNLKCLPPGKTISESLLQGKKLERLLQIINVQPFVRFPIFNGRRLCTSGAIIMTIHNFIYLN